MSTHYLKGKMLFLICLLTTVFILMSGLQGVADERKVTGYYYDPDAGKLLPKYDDLNPREVKAYLEEQEAGYIITTRGSWTYYTDQNGRRVKAIRKVTDANGNLVRIDKYFYDENGKVSYIDRMYYNEAGIVTRRYTVDYDEFGKVEGVIDKRYDSYGNLIRAYEYYGYVYHDNGKLKEYSRKDFDGNGNLYRMYSFEFNDQGRRILYDREDYDTNTGKKIRDYVIRYNDEGKRISYDYKQYDSLTGNLKRDYAATYDSQGRTSGVVDKRYDSEGNLERIYEYSNYSYHDNGKLASYTQTVKNGDGQVTRVFTDHRNEEGQRTSYTYNWYDPGTGNKTRDYTRTYDSQGRTSGVVDKRYDSEGNLDRSYEYSGYSYDSNGRLFGYTRTDRDGSGNVLRSYEYSNRTYDSEGHLIEYTRVDRDADGNVIRTCVWSIDTGWSCS